jgi:hypothetical protein
MAPRVDGFFAAPWGGSLRICGVVTGVVGSVTPTSAGCVLRSRNERDALSPGFCFMNFPAQHTILVYSMHSMRQTSMSVNQLNDK